MEARRLESSVVNYTAAYRVTTKGIKNPQLRAAGMISFFLLCKRHPTFHRRFVRLTLTERAVTFAAVAVELEFLERTISNQKFRVTELTEKSIRHVITGVSTETY